MKFIEKIQQLVRKTPKMTPEIFLSLILDESYIQAAAWELDEEKKPRILTSTSERAAHPTWEDRIRMADHAIGKLEEETEPAKLIKVVFGLGEHFLTSVGDIERSVRPHLKNLTKSLTLTPLGFVPISASISHYLKKSEGIPTSVILISVAERDFDVSIYRVGRLAFSISIKRTGSEGEDIENALKECTDADVLPSRILLYGDDDVRIAEAQSALLKYQWTARANFLHYPKIDIFPFEHLINTVVEAGANEITQKITDEAPVEEMTPEETPPVLQEEEKSEKHADTNQDTLTLEREPRVVKQEEKGPTHMVVVQPETLGFHETVGDADRSRLLKKETGAGQEESVENPLEFGEKPTFSKDPSFIAEERLEKISQSQPENEEFIKEEPYSKKTAASVVRSFHHRARKLFFILKYLMKKVPIGVIGVGIAVVILLGGGLWGVMHYFPRVTITLAVLPKTINQETSIVIDPQATEIDTEKKIIPAKKLEKVVSGEKTITTTGKKKVGDPAKGTVTVFNKSEGTSYTLKKGTILKTGSLQFTLDADVTVASASTNLSQGQTVFGKTSVTVTAAAVGTEGNIEANKEFSVKEYAESVLVARNDQPFTGGTSKDVTVVSRADYDTLQKELTSDLIEKAKTELTQSVSGKEKMIDQTIKTAVKEKQFVEEIDQEAKDLHGSLTVSVSAYTYNEEDITVLLSGLAKSDIPSGYSVNPGRTSVAVGDVAIAKDGKMSAKASLSTSAIPTIEETSIQKAIVGKKLTDVEKTLRDIPGVASAEFVFTSAWKRDVLPTNSDHISIVVTTIE